ELSIAADGPELSLKDLAPVVHHAKGYEPFNGTTGSPARLALIAATGEPGTVTYEWRLPATHDLPFDARRLELSWQFLNDPEKDNTVIKMYDWSAGTYMT